MASLLQQLLGGNGTMEFIDAAVSGKAYDYLIVNSACSLTTLTDSSGANLVSLYNFSGKTISAGNIIIPAKGGKITAVTPAAGTLIGYTSI